MSEMEMLELRKEIAALSIHKNARRYPAPLRTRVAQWAKQRLGTGASVAGICAELDVSEPTLRRLLDESANRQRHRRRAHRFTRLRVVEAAVATPVATVPSIVLRGPRGVVVEGLSVADVSRLLVELSCSV